MEMRKIETDKKQFLSLLLLADEQEDMIDRYLVRGEMFALYDDSLKGVCVATRESASLCEIKNIAVLPEEQGKGYGKAMIGWLADHYRGSCDTLQVGTGESPGILSFYQGCGFVYSHRIKNFFTDHYDHPIVDGGVLLVDMIYLRMLLP